jgi:hypothetical protein
VPVASRRTEGEEETTEEEEEEEAATVAPLTSDWCVCWYCMYYKCLLEPTDMASVIFLIVAGWMDEYSHVTY